MTDYEVKLVTATTLLYELLGMAFPETPDRPNTTMLNKTQSDEELTRAIQWLARVEGRLKHNG